jgi:hypothetical protein
MDIREQHATPTSTNVLATHAKTMERAWME